VKVAATSVRGRTGRWESSSRAPRRTSARGEPTGGRSRPVTPVSTSAAIPRGARRKRSRLWSRGAAERRGRAPPGEQRLQAREQSEVERFHTVSRVAVGAVYWRDGEGGRQGPHRLVAESAAGRTRSRRRARDRAGANEAGEEARSRTAGRHARPASARKAADPYELKRATAAHAPAPWRRAPRGSCATTARPRGQRGERRRGERRIERAGEERGPGAARRRRRRARRRGARGRGFPRRASATR
jgi:hypothetical protein